jgi:alpha-ketoglutarate-dependent sulfate ester dioxygenase
MKIFRHDSFLSHMRRSPRCPPDHARDRRGNPRCTAVRRTAGGRDPRCSAAPSGRLFRGQDHLDDAEHQAFARLLGPPVPHPTVPSLAGTEAVLEIDAENARASRWHTDGTYVDALPQFSVLRGLVIPPVGGGTVWANTVAAYETLPPLLRRPHRPAVGAPQQRLRLCRNPSQRDGSPSAYVETVLQSTIHVTEHPVVQVHPLTGERTIILGSFVRSLLGVSSVDSCRLFPMLQDHVTRVENTVRWRGLWAMWRSGTIARRSTRPSMITATSAALCAA